MKIYIDFDGTMFDTNRFYHDFLKICNQYGITDGEVNSLQTQLGGLFNLDEFAKKIGNDYKLDAEFLKQVESLYDKKYLYSDVIDFLEKYYQKNDLYILSYGEPNYQTKKINCCHIDKYFKEIIITENKGTEKIDYQNSYFIDNNPKEIKILSDAGATNIIRIKREGDSYFSVPCEIPVREYFAMIDIDML